MLTALTVLAQRLLLERNLTWSQCGLNPKFIQCLLAVRTLNSWNTCSHQMGPQQAVCFIMQRLPWQNYSHNTNRWYSKLDIRTIRSGAWTNDLYGYKFDRDKWTAMVILYQSEESGGPSMLEASLIDIYKGILVESLGRETYPVNFLSIDGMHAIACPIYFLLNQSYIYNYIH